MNKEITAITKHFNSIHFVMLHQIIYIAIRNPETYTEHHRISIKLAFNTILYNNNSSLSNVIIKTRLMTNTD